MRKMLRTWLRYLLSDSGETAAEDAQHKNWTVSKQNHKIVGLGSAIDHNIHGMNFTVYNATGGLVVEVGIYQRQTDSYDRSLYLITDEQQLGEELARIITMEKLKH